VYRKSTANQTW